MLWSKVRRSDALLLFVNLVPATLPCCVRLRPFLQVRRILWNNSPNSPRPGFGARSQIGWANELALTCLSDNSVAAAWEQSILANELMDSLRSRSRSRYLSVARIQTRSCDALR